MKIHAGLLAGLIVIASATQGHTETVCGTWNPVALPSASGNGLFSVSAASPSDIWGVGRGLYHWNGSNWAERSAPGLGSQDTLLASVAAVSANDAWIVGYSAFIGTPQTLAEHWDGSRWSVVPSPTVAGGSQFNAVAALAANDVWAVGSRNGGLPEFQTTVATLTAHWNGSTWTAIPSPNIANRFHELVDVAMIASNDVWAVGSSRNTTELYQSLILHWNGASWSVVPSPDLAGENSLTGISAVSANDIWAVGGAWDGITSRQIFLHWNGSSWTQVNGPGGTLACAGCAQDVVALGPDDVWAAGSTIGHWNGTEWTLVPNPSPTGATGLLLRSLAKIGPCDAWVIGGSLDSLGMESAFSAHLASGQGAINLSPVTQATAAPATGLAPLQVQFSSAGSFDPDGAIVSYAWNFGDGSESNSTLANPVHTYLQSGPLTYHVTLKVTDDRGAIAQANTVVFIQAPVHVESQSVTQVSSAGGGWSGQDVVLVADGAGNPVIGASVAATISGPTGGTVEGSSGSDGRVTLVTPASLDTATAWCFTVTGVSKAGYVYTESSNKVTAQCEASPVVGAGDHRAGRLALRVTPNPSRVDCAIQLSLPSEQPVTLSIFDVTGKLVREMALGILPAKEHLFRWDGMDSTGRPTGPGIYFVTAAAGRERTTARLLRID